MEIPIEGQKVLVKFHFTNPKLIPQEIRFVERREKAIEEKHGVEAGKMGISFGAQRKKRYDTGKYQQFNDVDMTPLWEQLKKSCHFEDIHCFFQKRSKGMKKKVIVVTFTKGKGGDIKASLVEEIERNFVHKVKWSLVHRWINDKGLYILTTLNCLGRQPQSL